MTTLDTRNLEPRQPDRSNSEFGKISSTGSGKRGEGSEILSFFKTLAIFLVLAFFLRASVVEAFKIPSGSMQPTLDIDDHILVWKFSYGLRLPFFKEVVYEYDQPERGDIVVFTRPDRPDTREDESDVNIIKRIIGLPGDTVEVNGMTVYINNSPLKEPWATQWLLSGAQERFGPEKVPPGHVFLLGDNRDHSKDSRFWEDSHFLDIRRIKGRAVVIYWSWRQPSRIGTVIH
ncbi:MAG: signal peptidase I [Deltaproteobacteria bacterium]|nr:signal peptidase I [Deltaproteobacteria bacterium]